jgi:hypothetical protein
MNNIYGNNIDGTRYKFEIYCHVIFLNAGSFYVAQIGLKAGIYLPQCP